jgi:hypothetical protein
LVCLQSLRLHRFERDADRLVRLRDSGVNFKG